MLKANEDSSTLDCTSQVELIKIFNKMPLSFRRQTLGTFMIRTHGIYKKNVVVIVRNKLPVNNEHNDRCKNNLLMQLCFQTITALN